MVDSSYLLPALVVGVVLCALHARIDVYDAFVSGAREGLTALAAMAPYLCAILMATALLRETGALAALERALAPALRALGLPPETAPVLLVRPLSGSAALAAVQDVLRECGADSRAGRIACIVSGASETVFFTASVYMGAAGVRRTRYAIPAALLAYGCGAAAAALLAGA